MKTALIIHGHFYQPPRENPSTGIVEDQPSAKPYKNWNEAIYQTCYRPNSNSRYLDNKGKIRLICNNYDRMSVNFGPTLLKWLDSEHPRFVEGLAESDNRSMEALGHSNFIAQCYNHTILPLDSLNIKRIEIAWALADYKKRFGHDSEGFWCSECAIDKETIDVLAENGVKFVVLSPWQATHINGKPLNGNPAPCDRPFIIKGNTSSLTAFFYDPDLASGISFGHYLTDADKLYGHLKDMKKNMNNPSLITCATDGEIYGHHEAFGDMALAALIKKVDDGSDFYVTNYGAYLEKNPAKETATLFEGKAHKGSSWSCCHGVERWISDCGCHTGGPDNWNQKWRGPFREALRNFEENAEDIIKKTLSSILGPDADFVDIVINYGSVVVNQITTAAYLAQLEEKYKKHLTKDEKKTISILLDSYKYVLYSFTSCGWFFNDISGLEPRQNITYAVNAAKMLQPYTKLYLRKLLLQDLEKAKSNIASEGTAADIAKKAFESNPGPVQACFFFIRNKRDKHFERFKYTYGFFNLRSVSDSIIIVENSVTDEIFRYSYSYETEDNNEIINLKNIENGFHYTAVINRDSKDNTVTQNDILENITNSFANEILTNGVNDLQLQMIVNTLDSVRSQGVEPNLTELQNVLYPYLNGSVKAKINPELKTKLVEKLNFCYDLL